MPSSHIEPVPVTIYLDVCVLSRPFDEQHYIRIRMETEAFNLVLAKVREGRYKMVVSAVHDKEIGAIVDTYERVESQTLLGQVGERVKVDNARARLRAEHLVSLGFGIADAAHVAFAELAGAQFISCDDALVRKCLRHEIAVWCGNPVSFCEKEGLR